MFTLFITAAKKRHTEIGTKRYAIVAMKNLAVLVSEECRKLWNFELKRKLDDVNRA